ncbi:hypothetical protein [Dactylosporangium sp. CA-139066]|uniref:hypothetical protein n=1 Tax=Dactylosporangium sp. CA-139066 TaxID=3239930 RepID=UPI003D92ECFD
MTAPREVGRAELEHPSWCDAANCPLELMAVGGRHQSREIAVHDDDGRRVASVVLQQAASGRLMVAAFSRAQSWAPHVAERLGEALRRAAEMAKAEQQTG